MSYSPERTRGTAHRSAADTPLLRVSRPVSACSRCRAAKIRCDGLLPACSACRKSGRQNECSSANDQFAKGKERSYVASLEAKVERLQKRLEYAKMRKASVAMHDIDEKAPEPDRKDSLATIRAAIHGKAARRREATDVDQLVSDFGVLSVNATTRDFDGSITDMTFARLILAASQHEALPKPAGFQLPSRSSVLTLVRYYLDHIYPLLPAFDETTLFLAIDAIYRDDGQAEDSQHATEFQYWLLYMVLAIGSVSQSRSSSDKYYEEGVAWVARALQFADKVLVPGYISQIQAMILLTQYSMLDPAHFDSWQLIGFACRAVVDLGFHQEPPKEAQPERKVLDLRRQIWWVTYALDRSISMVHARAFSFTDDSISVHFPQFTVHNPIPGGPISLAITTHLFLLRRIQSKWYQELFQSSRDPFKQSSTYVWQVCQEMRSWFENLPPTISEAQRDMFELELLYSYVYCLAPSCRVPAVSEIGKAFIYEYVLAYMSKISSVSADPADTGLYTYHDALRVYFMGSHFTAILQESKEEILTGMSPLVGQMTIGPPPPRGNFRPGENNVERSIRCIGQIKETLRGFGERWFDSKALQTTFEAGADPLLDDLMQRHQMMDMQAGNSRSPESRLGGSPSSVRQGLQGPGAVMAMQQQHRQQQAQVDEWAQMGPMMAPASYTPRRQPR